MRLKEYAISGWETSGSSKKLATRRAAVRKRVVDHARAGPDDAKTYDVVGERSREINPVGTRVENADRLAGGWLIELAREVSGS